MVKGVQSLQFRSYQNQSGIVHTKGKKWCNRQWSHPGNGNNVMQRKAEKKIAPFSSGEKFLFVKENNSSGFTFFLKEKDEFGHFFVATVHGLPVGVECKLLDEKRVRKLVKIFNREKPVSEKLAYIALDFECFMSN